MSTKTAENIIIGIMDYIPIFLVVLLNIAGFIVLYKVLSKAYDTYEDRKHLKYIIKNTVNGKTKRVKSKLLRKMNADIRDYIILVIMIIVLLVLFNISLLKL